MKKLMIAATAAFCATVSFAELASANIVGYRTYTLTEDYTLMGLCFEDVAGGGMSLNAAVPFADGMTKGATSGEADNLQIMGDDGNYKLYFLSNGKYGKFNASYSEDYDGKWLVSAGAECNDKVHPGQAFWYVSRTAKTTPHTITVAGSVLQTNATDPKSCTDTYTLIGNPYACDVPLNGGVVTTGATSGATSGEADNIQVMGEDGNYKLYFLSNGKYGKFNASYSEEFDGKWLISAGAECNDKVPMGRAFWYVMRNAGTTVKLINPIAE